MNPANDQSPQLIRNIMELFNFEQITSLWLLFVCIGLLIGSIIVMVLQARRLRKEKQAVQDKTIQLDLLRQELTFIQQSNEHTQLDSQNKLNDATHKAEQLQETLAQSQLKLGRLQAQSSELARQQDENHRLRNELEESRLLASKYSAQLDAQHAVFAQERKGFENQLRIVKEAEENLKLQFENLANNILEKKSLSFSESNEKNISQLIKPLKLQIDEFKQQINSQFIEEGKDRAALKTEILSLQALNKQITEEASALTNALKGDNKQQGNWGELVLERILQESGLRKNHEYETQKSLHAESGKRYQPDIVVHLPNDKDIVIDSKVSLTSFERYVNTDDENAKKLALKEHVASISGHIKGLSKKDYQALEGVKTLDYVLMFVPIEAAFIAAVEHQPQLIKSALDNQIMMVSPTNLLVALRTINNIWQYEYQNQNANKIAEQARKLYDKFVGFVADMDKVGKSIDNANSHFENAMNKLSTGKGNLIGQAEKFKTLGVSPTKSFDRQHLDN